MNISHFSIISTLWCLFTTNLSFASVKNINQNEPQKTGIRLAMTILYVKDQKTSTFFYKKVFGIDPDFDVPGMTQFTLENGAAIGLMPEEGIKSLLGERMPDPSRGTGIPRAELYLQVEHPEVFHNRVLETGGIEVSPLAERPWGDKVAYSLDPDGHVLAFSKR